MLWNWHSGSRGSSQCMSGIFPPLMSLPLELFETSPTSWPGSLNVSVSIGMALEMISRCMQTQFWFCLCYRGHMYRCLMLQLPLIVTFLKYEFSVHCYSSVVDLLHQLLMHLLCRCPLMPNMQQTIISNQLLQLFCLQRSHICQQYNAKQLFQCNSMQIINNWQSYETIFSLIMIEKWHKIQQICNADDQLTTTKYNKETTKYKVHSNLIK